MWALDHPCEPRTGRLFADTPVALLAVLALGVAATLALVGLGALPPQAISIVGITGGQGALLATALAWAHLRTSAAVVAVALLGLAGLSAGLGAAGAIAYLGPPFWVFWLARRGRLAGLGLGLPVPPRGVLAGALVGGFLGGHLLVSASRALGVHVRLEPVTDVLVALGYDVGANVLAAECFFRGALFDRARRRWSFAAAATLSTAAYVLRYLADPLLPKSVELVIGAVFYLTLLGAMNCWLLWWSGSLVPGLVSAFVFFAAYRTLSPG